MEDPTLRVYIYICIDILVQYINNICIHIYVYTRIYHHAIAISQTATMFAKSGRQEF